MNTETSNVPLTRHSAWKIWENPIFLRYCRSRLRLQGAGLSVLVVVLIAGFIVAMAQSVGTYLKTNSIDAARPAVGSLLIFQGIILFIFGTAQTAGGMTAERDEGVIDYQRLIPMTPLAKVFGYLFGLPVREYLMFLSTLPFTAYCLWRGEVPWQVWLPLYGIVFSTTLLYHFTGLLTGTVVRNRRWAFLVSIGLVFCLYTIIPKLASFGLVFFKYLTITPVFNEILPYLMPEKAGAAWKAGQDLMPTVKFFNLDFSEAVFTLFSQCGLILTFTIMLCRKWRRAESHLLGKVWAAVFFIWVQGLLLGNALPLIEPGNLFPSRGLSQFTRTVAGWVPTAAETVTLSGVYGLASLGLLFFLAMLITPTKDHQLRGLRRARKQGEQKLAFLADASTSFWFVLVMALAAAGGWFIFTRALVESRWFPGHEVPLGTLGYFAAVMVGCGTGFQALLENKGGRTVGLVAIFLGGVPIMIGSVLGPYNNLVPLSSWFIGISPLSMPIYASATLLSIAELPAEAARAVPRAFYFWLSVLLLVTIRLLIQLRASRKAMADKVFADS